MAQRKPQTAQEIQFNQTERLIDVLDSLNFSIEGLRGINGYDYSIPLMELSNSLREIGNGYRDEGCLKKIHQELHLLNKTLIMSALLLSATKKPEETLKEYQKIIKEYLD